MGCLRTVGCFTTLLVVAGLAWFFRADWVPLVDRPIRATATGSVVPTPARSAQSTPPPPAAPELEWQSVTAEGTSRARDAVRSLDRRAGPVFANVAPADLVAYVYQQLAKELPPSADNVEAAAADEELWVRADVKLSDFGGARELGPLASVLGERERVSLGGTLDVVRPGTAEFRVHDVKIRDFPVPGPLVSKLMRRLARGPHPAGVAAGALTITLPSYIADVRILRDKITLYKSIP